MNDPRLIPDQNLAIERTERRVIADVTDLFRTPSGPRDRQLLFGTPVARLSVADGWAYVQSRRDGYVGFVRDADLGADITATHRISVAGSTLYREPDLKSPDIMGLSHGCVISAIGSNNCFVQIGEGYVPQQHVAGIAEVDTDPAEVAAIYLGVPYLWGGNSIRGIDCSGLVQAALLACGILCPGDSDMQEECVGKACEGPPRRNDLLFWKGHVALVTDAQTLIHANAHAMAVTYEPIADTIARIDAAGDGPVTAHRRIASLSG